jgi:hypothetical protein
LDKNFFEKERKNSIHLVSGNINGKFTPYSPSMKNSLDINDMEKLNDKILSNNNTNKLNEGTQ